MSHAPVKPKDTPPALQGGLRGRRNVRYLTIKFSVNSWERIGVGWEVWERLPPFTWRLVDAAGLMAGREGLRPLLNRQVEDFFASDEAVPVLVERLKRMGGATFCSEFKFLTGRVGTHQVGATMLHRAAFTYSGVHLEALLQIGAPVDATDPKGWTVLHMLCGCFAHDIAPLDTPQSRAWMNANLRLLVGAGADMNVRCDVGFGLGRPIEVAALAIDYGHSCFVDMMSELVLLGADCDTQDDDGDPVLFLASATGQVELMLLLLDWKKVDIDHRNRHGETALFTALPATFAHLLRLGADMTIKNTYGETPLLRMDNNGYVSDENYERCAELWIRELQSRWSTTTACSKLPLPLIHALTRVFYCVAGRPLPYARERSRSRWDCTSDWARSRGCWRLIWS